MVWNNPRIQMQDKKHGARRALGALGGSRRSHGEEEDSVGDCFGTTNLFRHNFLELANLQIWSGNKRWKRRLHAGYTAF